MSVQITTPHVEELELQDLQLLLPDFCLLVHKAALAQLDRCTNRSVGIYLGVVAPCQY